MGDEGDEPCLSNEVKFGEGIGKAGGVGGGKGVYGLVIRREIEKNESLLNGIVNAFSEGNRFDLAEMVSQEMSFGFDGKGYSESEIGSESKEGI